jgi:hypothetical protein
VQTAAGVGLIIFGLLSLIAGNLLLWASRHFAFSLSAEGHAATAGSFVVGAGCAVIGWWLILRRRRSH